jgi:hypothetical protein
MPFPAFTGGVANINPAVFLSVYIKTGSEKWQTLGAIAQGVLNVEDFNSPDSLTRNLAIGSLDFTAKCRMMQSSNTELDLIDSICNGSNSFLFKLADAVAITTGSVASAGWVYVTNAQVGCTSNLMADGTPEDNRYIELSFQGTILRSTAAIIQLYTPSLIDTDFASTAVSGTYMGTLGVGGIGLYTATKDGGNPQMAQIRSCGVSTMTLDLAGGASPVTIAPVTNIKMSFNMLPFVDSIRRFLPKTMDISIDADCMATLNADLLSQDNMTPIAIKLIIAMIDGVTFTLDNQVGIHTNFETNGDMDKPRVLRFTHKGKILNSSFAAVVTQA